jgi:tetratricopeptide (TPR) repeat protein
VLTVVKYVNIIADPESGEIIAISVEPIANVSQKPDGKFYYELIDKILGWVEYDDVLVKRTGIMIKETNWFQDPPENLSEDILFKRNYLRAVRDINKGMYKEAMLELEIVSKIDPSYENIGYLIGFCYAKLNRYDDAVKYFTEYLKKNENDAKSWTELAYLYLRQNNFSDAINAYERLSKLIPDDPHIWVDMGDIYRQLGNIQKSKEAYLKALEIDPINEQAEYELK